jgi:hypothetical protein
MRKGTGNRAIKKAAKTGDWSHIERAADKALSRIHGRLRGSVEFGVDRETVPSEAKREPKPIQLADLGLPAPGDVDRKQEPEDEQDEDQIEEIRPDIRPGAKPVRSRSLDIERYRGAGRWVAEEQKCAEACVARLQALDEQFASETIDEYLESLSPEHASLVAEASAEQQLAARMRRLPAKERPICEKALSSATEQERHKFRGVLDPELFRPHGRLAFWETDDEPKKTGRPAVFGRKLTDGERKQLSRARKIIAQRPRLENLSARLACFAPA